MEPPAVQLFLSCRPDELVAMGNSLRTWLPELAEGGHSLHFWQIGLENFSPEENLRFSRGYDSELVERAVALLTELESSWPSTFFFRRHGGFAMIVFTPWSRLEDLRINGREQRRLGLAEPFSGMLTSRLQLRAGTPLELLAQQDGLSLHGEAPDSNPYDIYSIGHWGEEEIPWRFAHAGVDAVYSVMVQLFPRDRHRSHTPRLPLVTELRRSKHPVAQWECDTLVALANLAEEDPSSTDAELLDRLVARFDEIQSK